MKADLQATEAMGFKDERSYLAPDSRQVLYGKDWEARKLQLWERCGGRCEEEGVLERCKNEAADPHHVIPRSKGRDDRIENLLALCRFHHNLLDKRQPRWSNRTCK